MSEVVRAERAVATCQQYRALLAVSEAIVSQRDLQGLFHDLAGRLHQVVRFDYLGLVLHDAANNTTRLHVLETSEPTSSQWFTAHPADDEPAGVVLETQEPL